MGELMRNFVERFNKELLKTKECDSKFVFALEEKLSTSLYTPPPITVRELMTNADIYNSGGAYVKKKEGKEKLS